jgi:hypothetical protein
VWFGVPWPLNENGIVDSFFDEDDQDLEHSLAEDSPDAEKFNFVHNEETINAPYKTLLHSHLAVSLLT